MAFHGIKTNIAIKIAILLAVAMLLVDIIMVITAQRDYVQSAISKGYLLAYDIEKHLIKKLDSGILILQPDYSDKLDVILNMAGFSCAIIQDRYSNMLYPASPDCPMSDEIRIIVEESIESSRKMTRFTGTAWGVFWMQNRYLVVSAPLLIEGHAEAGVGIVMELEDIYKVLRRTQKVLFVYSVINLFVLTITGLYLILNIAVKPVQRMVKRAEEFREEDDFFFLDGKHDNEFDRLSKALNRLLKRVSEDKEKLLATISSLEKANIDLKQAQKDVVMAEKLASVGRLSSGIAHEVGNPIGIIIGYLELLKQKDMPDDEKNEYIKRAENEINRVNGIIRQLLDFSRPSEGKPEIINVHEVIEDVAEIVRFQPFTSGIDLKISLEAREDRVLTDPNQLRQIFINLIINAADAISSSQNKLRGKLLIKSEVVSESDNEAINDLPVLKISFIDNGSGIPEKNIGNIFDPFYTTKEPGKGTGLGLFVSFALLDGMGGKIKAQSVDGEGTTMSVYLPLSNENVQG
ncbi:MAG: ATP-binding protein [Pseudomonadota bacterium]